ncbi:MAG: hypothetical protein FWE37_00790 [Spirochaetaceae bacterium]|nr:hypothetical protein [Spirochaetaceae bacterium]
MKDNTDNLNKHIKRGRIALIILLVMLVMRAGFLASLVIRAIPYLDGWINIRAIMAIAFWLVLALIILVAVINYNKWLIFALIASIVTFIIEFANSVAGF